MPVYISRQNDMVDAICRRVYGDESDYVEAVLAANPGLAQLGPVLPPNVVIDLPDLAEQRTDRALVKLWD